MRNVQRWTYSHSPGSSPKDSVRFLIGDIDDEDKQVDDCEIQFVLSEDGSIYEAAYQLCLMLAAYYARQVDETTGKTTKGYSTRSQHYADLATKYKERRGGRPVSPFFGGSGIGAKETVENDNDRVQPFFTRETQEAPASRLDPIQKTVEG